MVSRSPSLRKPITSPTAILSARKENVMRKHKSRESFANNTCRDAGHDWMTTAAADWRTCQRERCRASERLVDGQRVSNARLYKLHDPAVASRKRQRHPRPTVMCDYARRTTINAGNMRAALSNVL